MGVADRPLVSSGMVPVGTCKDIPMLKSKRVQGVLGLGLDR